MEKICQISPYGGQSEWQKIGLKQYPETKWFILIANTPDYGEIDFFKQANELKSELEKEQEKYPEKFQIQISVLDITGFTEDYHRLFSYVNELFRYLINLNYKILVNATSGLQLVRMVLYQVSLLYRVNIKNYFTYNKVLNTRQDVWLQRSLNENESLILEILKSKGKLSVSEVLEDYRAKLDKGSLPYLVKIIQKMITSGLLTEEKLGRVKYIELSEIGYALVGDQEFRNQIIKTLEET